MREASAFESSELASIADTFPDLSTSLVAAACQRLNIGLRVAPAGIRSLHAYQRLIGRAIPVRYYGSIDVVLEALEDANPGDILVIDNKGRLYEACMDHLTALEATSAGIAGAVVWGMHRETDKVSLLDFALFSYGSFPRETSQLRQAPPGALAAARIGIATVTRDDVVVADADGVLFVPSSRLGDILEAAKAIAMNQRDRVGLVGKGTNLRQQFGFQQYLTIRQEDPTYTFRKHLRSVGEAWVAAEGRMDNLAFGDENFALLRMASFQWTLATLTGEIRSNDGPRLLTVREVSERLRLSRSNVYQLLATGRISSFSFGSKS